MKKNIKVTALLLALILCMVSVGCSFGNKNKTDDTSASEELETPADKDTQETEKQTEKPKETEKEPEKQTEKPVDKETEAPETKEPEEEVTTAPEKEFKDEYYFTAKSDTKTNLDITLKAVCKKITDDLFEVTADVYLESYALFTRARDDGYIVIGENKINFSTPAFEYDGEDKQNVKIASYKNYVTADQFSKGASLVAGWHFNGSYSGIDMNWIEAGTVMSAD